MLTSLAVLALLAPQSTTLRPVLIPMAKIQVHFIRDLEPVPPDRSSRLESRGRMGWETESNWYAKAPSGELRMCYWTYGKGKKPIMSPKELATELYSNSELVDEKEELARRYSDRKVVDAKLGAHPATIDLHLDKEENRYWGILAFGDDREQWMVEVQGDAKEVGMVRAVRSIVAGVKPIPFSNDELAKRLLKKYAFPGTGFEIGAPACFAARLPYAEEGRPKLWSHRCVLELCEEFSISVQDNAYSDKKQPNLRADLDYLQGSLRDGSRKLGKGEHVAGKIDGWVTLMRVQPFTEAGKQHTIVWSYWASPGRTIFGMVKVSDRLGGKARAIEMAMSLRPVKK